MKEREKFHQDSFEDVKRGLVKYYEKQIEIMQSKGKDVHKLEKKFMFKKWQFFSIVHKIAKENGMVSESTM